ncbi:group-specific protein [Bacillus cytotoxicus]|uniref:group-specific protein n=1 Tax=Bacillus cytotoxicus TaxID=580165 RepID=UPI00065F88F4|nr:group-specific protein [Bacillus cytotoxicus]AWC32971.1 group-specific protein [Bacillus cytotoxicus]AWC36998.1 group-specific protein [Bacillus cytotoxicus]AWC61261.1 group-specific protein [Bacillus cytotoxicus]KMT48442.1 group-specific protein [Bacillus cytotoxicus]HDR7311018.1 group-specific protein [Bacillus cytotoxicus]
MSEVERIMECCERQDDVFRTYIMCLLQLKQYREHSQNVYQELRTDYLARGICEQEVDQLIKESETFQAYYLPKVLCWDFLSENPAYIESALTNVLKYEPLQLSIVQWRRVIACVENEVSYE